MPRLVNSVPKYRKHASGQAVVRIGGRDHYLGKFGTAASKQEYKRRIAEWVADDRPAHVAPAADITITEVCGAFLRYAKKHYVKRGRVTDEVASYAVVLRYLKDLYGRTAAADFGPKGLKAIRDQMIAAGNCRNYINGQTSRVKHIFKWAAAEELAPVEVYHRLAVVPGLPKGKTAARETAPVAPVDDNVVDATLPHLKPVVAAMVGFQRLTGARPGEVCGMRPKDIDRTGDVWRYVPAEHKMDHHDRGRIIYIGPQAQEVLKLYLFGDDLPCFRSPKSPRGFNSRSYRDRIASAVERANKARIKQGLEPLPTWAPNQLRHNAGTAVRQRFGLEAAQVVLGHSKADVTQVYAERDQRLAVEVARQVG
jgi:integrase